MSDILSQLPEYDIFCEQIAALALPISASQMHGTLSAYLCMGALFKGEAYLRALTTNHRGELTKIAIEALFNVYTISLYQMQQDNFSFQLLLPDDEQSLSERAQAFSEWCVGFIKAVENIGVNKNLLEEDSQEALSHLTEFSELDYHALQINEEDERALMEVSEYTRMAVLRLYWDIKINSLDDVPDAEPIKH